MTEKVKNRLCELAGYKYWPQNLDCNEDIELAIPIKAMWAINDICVLNNFKGYLLARRFNQSGYLVYKNMEVEKEIFDDKYNNDKQKSLTASLEFIIENQPAAESATNADSEN